MKRLRWSVFFFVFAGVIALAFWMPAQSNVAVAQQSTGSVPTVTGTSSGPFVTVYTDIIQVDVYAGPSSYLYPPVGVLVGGQSAPVIGRARDEDWLQIIYLGIPGSTAWVYAPYVRISPGARLPFVDAPPTPTALSTPTIDATLAAAFLAPQTPTRLATFTAPAPLSLPEYNDDVEQAIGTRIPLGLLIFSFGFVGALGVLISFLRGR
ncbi:MAG: hypothetical protein Kow002_12200 [Anaerolineales bacterium]